MDQDRRTVPLSPKIDDEERTKTILLRRFFNEHQKRTLFLPGDDPQYTLFAIERFVFDAIDSDKVAFRIRRTTLGGTTSTGNPRISTHFSRMNEYLLSYVQNRYYSIAVALFFSVCRELNLFAHRFVVPDAVNAEGITDAELFNQLIEGIREQGRSPAFRKSVARESYCSFRRFCGLVDYVDALFEHVRSRLIIIRLDLKYHRNQTKTTVDQAQEDLQRLWANGRHNALFDDMVGYIWRMEVGRHGGIHFHIFLFFTNDRLQNDSYRAQQIGEYWERVITGGRGTYYNCNATENKSQFDHYGLLAIGRVEHHDASMRFNLLRPLAYICKAEQTVPMKPRAKSRAYGRGEMPPVRDNKLGRPRERKIDSGGYLVLISGYLAQREGKNG